jgi:hypothetical protein
MGTLVVGVIGLALLAILVTAALRLVHRRRGRRARVEGPAARYQREIREIQRITGARSERRYTRQIGDVSGGDYGAGSGV